MKPRHVILMVLAAALVVAFTACSPAGSGGTTPPPSASCAAPAVLPGTISAPTTLQAGCYAPASDVTVDSALTLRPGVTILMSAGSGIYVSASGSLNAVGTSSQPIVVEGNGNHASGFWAGVDFSSASSANELTYVTVKDAGGPSDGDVYVYSGASVSITYSTIENSAGYGVYAQDGALLFPAFSGNKITGNVSGAMWIPAELMSSLDSATDYSGNATDYVEVAGAVQNASSVTWPALNVPYYASGDVTLQSDVVAAPGLMMAFGNNIGLYVGDGVTNAGSLSAVGTSSQPIVFMGHGSTSPGYWADINFDTSSAANELTYVTVKGAGGPSDGDVYVYAFAGATVTNSTINDSAGYGICVQTNGAVTLDSPDSNSYINDPLGDVKLNC